MITEVQFAATAPQDSSLPDLNLRLLQQNPARLHHGKHEDRISLFHLKPNSKRNNYNQIENYK